MDNDEQPKPRALKPREERFVRAAEKGLATQGDYEVSVPRAIARVDGVFKVRSLGGFFGPLEPWMEHRVVAFEAYSGAVPRAWLADACFKAGWLAKSWLKRPPEQRHGNRPPLLVVVSSRRFPTDDRGHLTEQIAPGIWRAHVGAAVELLLVDLPSVPVENGTTGLHMLRMPSDHEGARVLEAFLGDPTIDAEIRADFREAIMNDTIPVAATEYRTVSERVHAEGFAEGAKWGERRGERRGIEKGIVRGREQGIEQGIVRGREQGIEHARRSVIQSVRSILGDEAAASLEDIRDFDALSARAFELLTGRR